MEHVMNWSQVSVCIAGAIFLIVKSLSALITTMTTSYGSVIQTLRAKDDAQGAEIAALRVMTEAKASRLAVLEVEVKTSKDIHAECLKREIACQASLAELRGSREADQRRMGELEARLAKQEQKI